MNDDPTDTSSEPTDRFGSTNGWDDVVPSVSVIEHVTEATGRGSTELPPLHDYIDTDALDTLLTGKNAADVRISFRYAGVEVTAGGDGMLIVQPAD